MEDPKFINPVGYSEMYEWKEVPIKSVFGRFVQFSKDDPQKIEYYNGGNLVGISTIQSTITSDDPEEWRYTYICSEVGDRYLQEESIAVGVKQYDQLNEMSFINTQPYKYLKTINSDYVDKNKKYIKRSRRKEWTRVNLIGKAIVEDDGTCEAGGYCMPTTSDINIERGKATKYSSGLYRFYVLRRLTQNTIEILNTPNLFNYGYKV